MTKYSMSKCHVIQSSHSILHQNGFFKLHRNVKCLANCNYMCNVHCSLLVCADSWGGGSGREQTHKSTHIGPVPPKQTNKIKKKEKWMVFSSIVNVGCWCFNSMPLLQKFPSCHEEAIMPLYINVSDKCQNKLSLLSLLSKIQSNII